MEVVANKELWTKYADIICDDNPFHRDEDFARRFGLEGVIAPGMWTFSNLPQGNFGYADVTFRKEVYDGTRLQVKINDGNYSFISGDKVMLNGRMSRNYLPPPSLTYSEPESIFLYTLTEDKVAQFLESVGKLGNYEVPSSLLMSLSAPALLGYGKDNNLTGIHLKQTFEQYCPAQLGLIKITIYKNKVRPNLAVLDNFWTQGNNLIASGKSTITPIQMPITSP